jgi:hypothetical protein
MASLWFAGLVALATGSLSSGPPAAPAERVALIPVSIVNADPGNGARMTEALAANLERHGSRVLDGGLVRRALEEMRVPLDRPVFLPALTALGKRLGADLVIYARVLVQGPTVHADALDRGRPAVILHLMVAHPRSGELLMTSEVFQEWQAADPMAGEQAVSRQAAAEAAERLLSRLYLPLSVRGRVLDEETGAPVPEAEVLLQQEGMPTRVALADEAGGFAFTDLVRGPYTVAARGPRFYSASGSYPPGLGERQVAISVACRPASLAGVLRDPSGRGLGGRQVEILDGEGATVARLTTLRDGTFGLTGLKPGSYRLCVSLVDGSRLQQAVELRAGDAANIALRAP